MPHGNDQFGYVSLDDRREIAQMVADRRGSTISDCTVTIETNAEDPSTERHRLAAIILSIMSIFTVFFGTCCCSIPALILALVPNCSPLSKSRLVRPIYIASIVCAVLAFAMAISVLAYTISHHLRLSYDNFEEEFEESWHEHDLHTTSPLRN